MTILTATANILPHLAENDRPVAVYQGLLQVARECAGKPPRFVVEPLPTGETRPDVFKQWFRDFIDVRDEDAAERCLQTAIRLDFTPRDVAEMIFAAATDHIYLDAGPRGGLRQQGIRAFGSHRLGVRQSGADQPGSRNGARPA